VEHYQKIVTNLTAEIEHYKEMVLNLTTLLYECNHPVCSPSCVYGECVDPNVCNCDIGYTGDVCDVPVCYGSESGSVNVCNKHGSCISPDNCDCDTWYYEDNCDMWNCATIPKDDPSVCSGFGQCVGPEICRCQPGRMGLECDDFFIGELNECIANLTMCNNLLNEFRNCTHELPAAEHCCDQQTENAETCAEKLKNCTTSRELLEEDLQNCTTVLGTKDSEIENCQEILETEIENCQEELDKEAIKLENCTLDAQETHEELDKCKDFILSSNQTLLQVQEDLYNCLNPMCFPPCVNGYCTSADTCKCPDGYWGEFCNENANITLIVDNRNHTCYGYHFEDPRACGCNGYCFKEDLCVCKCAWYGKFCQHRHGTLKRRRYCDSTQFDSYLKRIFKDGSLNILN